MTQVSAHLSTGLSGLDRAFRGLIPGDNIVWQVDTVEDYVPFVGPYCNTAIQRGEKVTYFRFADHPPLVENDKVQVCHVDAREGLEQFVGKIHRAIKQNGRGGFYVFDCLSGLAEDWYSDQMLGNFFMLTCPYLFDVEAIAYFGLLRNCHSAYATTPISETAQVLINVYRHKGEIYIHPLKVQQRHSPTMYMLHVWREQEFLPVTQSATIAEILSHASWMHLETAAHKLGAWNTAFQEAHDSLYSADVLSRGPSVPSGREESRKGAMLERLLRMAISRDERVLNLVRKYLTLEEVVNIGMRVVGTGLIGGKSVGMLLARAILRKADPRWGELLEPHDSFFIGSDVFYNFLVRNGVWWTREKQRDPEHFLEGADNARHRMVVGTFPSQIHRHLEYMLDYFGQSPIIVRSSSLLEDNFGNAFAGKYESVFCANQGARQKRLEDFLSAVRTIYASTMSEKALTYRAQRGMLDRDEQMGLLVQRVSGMMYGHLFYPQIGGVALSFNPYVWSEHIDPQAGMLRLAFGLGTRAVNRSDDDYTRIVALNDPDRRPESNFDKIRRYAQRIVDVLDLEANQLVSCQFSTVAAQSPHMPLDMFASRDLELESRAEGSGRSVFPWVLTFDQLLNGTPFVADMRQMLGILQDAYGCPVDVEFTVNFFEGNRYKIDLVQCRPLQVSQSGPLSVSLGDIRPADIVLEAHGAVIGQSRSELLDRLVFVNPGAYHALSVSDKYAVARLIGRICHLRSPEDGRKLRTMLLGPGRWGTSTPSLGVPVNFAEISPAVAVCEIVAMSDNMAPDVSLGTHFFNELVEMDMLYVAMFPGRAENSLNWNYFDTAPNLLGRLIPSAAAWENVVRVIDARSMSHGIRLYADTFRQRVVCFMQK